MSIIENIKNVPFSSLFKTENGVIYIEHTLTKKVNLTIGECEQLARELGIFLNKEVYFEGKSGNKLRFVLKYAATEKNYKKYFDDLILDARKHFTGEINFVVDKTEFKELPLSDKGILSTIHFSAKIKKTSYKIKGKINIIIFNGVEILSATSQFYEKQREFSSYSHYSRSIITHLPKWFLD